LNIDVCLDGVQETQAVSQESLLQERFHALSYVTITNVLIGKLLRGSNLSGSVAGDFSRIGVELLRRCGAWRVSRSSV
jgi:hypothetical protein